jgi:ribosomal protein L37AE/L43A
MKKNYINGRYGLDSFSKFLLIASAVLVLIKSYPAAVVFAGYGIFRILSKDFQKRQREEMGYKNFVGTLKYRLSGLSYKISKKLNWGIFDRIKSSYNNALRKAAHNKNYKIVKCPQCKQKLRLPKNKGNLVVTCKTCKHEFKKRT